MKSYKWVNSVSYTHLDVYKRQLICRVPVEYDARLKKIVLTEYAQEIRKQIGAQIERAEAQMTEGFTQEELERFFGYIDRMCANLEKCE